MDKIKILGGKALRGKVQVSGAKNAALPIIIATLLSDKKCVLNRVPRLQDIITTIKVLEGLGVKTKFENNTLEVDAKEITSKEAPYDLVRKMRASVLVLGPLLSRYGEAKVSLPGGCAIGARPIDFHLKALQKLGAEIQLESGYIIAKSKKLIGTKVVFDFPSVGATENVMMAAVFAKGETRIENCAKEPEIIDLANFLRGAGVPIEGDGTETIKIQGVQNLKPVEHEIIADRIEAGTFLAAAMATRGAVEVEGIRADALESVLVKFEESGAKVFRKQNSIVVESQDRPQAIQIKTMPFPGFPTDMQAQLMAMLCVGEGTSVITETIFENRFMHVPELCRLGADLTIQGNSVIVKGKETLIGAPLMATDLRASASLVIGGLCAEGETVVNRIYHLDRGYENMEKKLTQLGAQIERIKE